MPKDNSFDIVSEIDLAEVKNAVNQAMKEVVQRYDLKSSNSTIDFDEKEATLTLNSADEYSIEAVKGVLIQKLVMVLESLYRYLMHSCEKKPPSWGLFFPLKDAMGWQRCSCLMMTSSNFIAWRRSKALSVKTI